MNSPSSVEYEKRDLNNMMVLYRLIRDCIKGSDAIKDGRVAYLPHPDPMNAASQMGIARYDSYIKRAVFYNITGNTVKGMLGQIFSRDPVIKMPAQLQVMTEDVSGSGISLSQQSRQVAEDVIALGRHGLLTEYPRVEGPTSQADLNNGNVRPIILNFAPENIKNWRESIVNNRRKYTLVVLKDKADSITQSEEDFSEDFSEVYRELRLVNVDGNWIFKCRFWQQLEEGGPLLAGDWLIPTKSDGKPFDEIPFSFVGADNNDSSIDEPPMRDIAELNVAHYRNSADYEESVFMLGQPTPVLTGLTVQWVKEVLADNPIIFGSRVAIKLPSGATASILQAPANGMAKEAMDTKESQMVALGARLVQQRDVQRTASEYNGDRATQTSILATISRNVTAAYLKCFKWACDYSGANYSAIDFELNTDFDLAKMSPEEIAQVIAAWQAKAISFTEMRFALKKGGAAYQEDEVMRDEASNDPNIISLNLDNPNESNPPANGDPVQNNPQEDE